MKHVFNNKDPRRLQPLVDHIVEQFMTVDFNGDSSFDAVKVLAFFRSFYDEMGWKFVAWTEDVLARCWPELEGEHEDVRMTILYGESAL